MTTRATLWWVAYLTFGEGWHNNHHAHPQSARHGLAWYEFDVNWYGIKTLEALGLVWDVKLPKLGSTRIKAGSGAGACDATARRTGRRLASDVNRNREGRRQQRRPFFCCRPLASTMGITPR